MGEEERGVSVELAVTLQGRTRGIKRSRSRRPRSIFRFYSTTTTSRSFEILCVTKSQILNTGSLAMDSPCKSVFHQCLGQVASVLGMYHTIALTTITRLPKTPTHYRLQSQR